MDQPKKFYVAFRAYGSFAWPPLPKSASNKDTRDGAVEIYYVEEGPDLRAILRWLPRSDGATAAFDPAEAGKYLHGVDDKWLKAAFSKGEASVALRLDGDTNSATEIKGERLLFRGASVFDQFALLEDAEASEPDRRWVLARSYEQGPGTFFSEAVVGSASDTPKTAGTTIRFNLALPTPVPQAMVAGKPVRALPFSVTYPAMPKKSAVAASGLLPVGTFRAGSTAAGAVSDTEISLPATISDKTLGGFGFSRTDGGSEFVFFPRTANDAARREFWLDDEEVYRDELLGRFGDVSGMPKADFRFGRKTLAGNPPRLGEFWDSVEFPKVAGRSRMVFRSGIASEGVVGQGGNDLSVASLSGSFLIRNPDDPGQRLDTQSTRLTVELELDYALPTPDIWRVRLEPVGDPTVTVRLGFDSSLANVSSSDHIHFRDLFADAVAGMHLARIDLQHIDASQPQSILPHITNLSGKGARFALTANIAAEFAGEGRLDWGRRPPGDGWSGADFRLTLWPRNRFIGRDRPDVDERETRVPLTARIAPYSFAYRDTGSASIFSVELVYDPAAPKQQGVEFCQFRLLPKDIGKDALVARLGGLEFATKPAKYLFDDDRDEDEVAEYSHLRFGRRTAISDAAEKVDYTTAGVDVRLRFDVTSVRPLGIDIPWGDRSGRAPPLLIPLGASRDSAFILDLRETLSHLADRHLTGRLLDRSEGDGDAPGADGGAYVVIGQEPFTVAKFHSTALGNRGAQDNAFVAAYDSDTRNWELKLVAPHYHYEFPPQVAGESMDKPRRLEIHDGDPKAKGPTSPVVGANGDVLRMRAVEYRLTPSAELWIEPSDVLRGYFLPEWASHEIFRQRGAYGLGAALAALRGEFLYGLAVGIDTNRETGIARGARVAEIEALTGRPPGKPSSSNADRVLARRWGDVSKAIARRPERLEIWNRDLDSETAFSPARFAAGVSFALRHTAVHHPALARVKPVEGEDRPRVRPHGLRGGALWPVESANLYNRLLELPASNGGTIERIALSPHGGDADQKAEFLSQQVAIISETRSGFVQRHKIEVIGRIGVFWHRAKHVVVYERTVNPSAQFTPEGGIGTRTRRPVLRKVSEYVELLQPSRSYPDFPAAKPQTSGFLDAVRFNSKIINVDSAWSEDVGTYGWKIPLWNRDSARKRPQVYPRPDIGFVTRAEGEGETPLATQECLSPDNLYFFADFEKGGNDTDLWQSRIGIDCSALPAPAHRWQAPVAEDDSGEQRLPGVLRTPRGHRRFTWRLAPAAQKTALNAGRSNEPLFAGLETITFMRSSPADGTSLETALGEAVKAADGIVTGARLPLWPAGPGTAPPPLQDIGIALDEFRSADKTNVVAKAAALSTALATMKDKVAQNGALRSYVDDAREAVAGFDKLKGLLGNLPARCEKLADDLLGSLQRKQLVILEALAAWENDAYALAAPVIPPITITQLKALLVEEAAKALKPALADMSVDRLGLGSGTEAARAIIRDFESDVIALETTLDAKLAELRRSYDDGKPWSPSRISAFLAKLDAERQRVVGDVGSAVADARLRLGTELDDLSQRVGAIAAEALSEIAGTSSELQTKLSEADSGLRDKLDLGIEKLDGLLAKDASGKDKFDLIDEKLAKAEAKAGKYQNRVKQLRELVKKLRTRAVGTRAQLATLKTGTAESAAEISKAIAAATAAAQQVAHELHAIVTEALAVAGEAASDGLAELETELTEIANDVSKGIGEAVTEITSIGQVVDWAVDAVEKQVREALSDNVFPAIKSVLGHISDVADVLAAKVADLEDTLSANGLIELVLKPKLLVPAVNALFQGVNGAELVTDQQRLVGYIGRFSETVKDQFKELSKAEIDAIRRDLVNACNALGGGLGGALGRLEDMGKALVADAEEQIRLLASVANDATKLLQLANKFDRDIRAIGNELASSYSAAGAYAERVIDTAGNLGSGGLASAPGNILKLYAAVASAPDLPNLEFARERLGYYYKELNEIIDTTPVEAWFGRLGDELKALGISLPFDKLGDRLLPDDLSSLDISRVFKNFGGMKLDSLFKGYKLPKGAKDAIKITHAFDKKAFRAWVQIDVDVPIPGRRSMFSIGPFQLDFVNSRMLGQVRLEASKDSDRVEQTGRASVGTDIEAVVGGQTMVSLRKVVVRYERSGGLKVDFDPKNIKLNAIFQFIQETLGQLFPDEVGALKLIKQNGIPVGVEHEFAIPPIDLMYGTSGVTNIQISNRFALVAYPDFVISDRFSLSKPELPFLFSIFIIGGTGYITVDTEYRPFDRQLMVMVEAAAGGSAALGFAFGPVSGSVFITLSIALMYRKVIGKPGGGLTVSLVLVIAGNVNVANLVTVYIGLLLRMSYRDNGQIDATGTLTLTIKISRFFKIKVRANVQYKLRGGRSQTTSSIGTDVEVTDEKMKKAKEKAEKLLEARG